MLEWLALLLFLPTVIVAVVLLFGFAGCSLLLSDDEPEFERAFETSLDGDRQRRNRTIIQRIEAVRLFRSGTSVRITLQRPPADDLIIQRLAISQVAETGDPYDAAGDLTEVLAEPLLVTSDPEGGLLELDPVDYALDADKPLLLAFDIGDLGRVTDLSNVAASDAAAFVNQLQNPPIHEAVVPDRQPGYDVEDRIYLVRRLDVA